MPAESSAHDSSTKRASANQAFHSPLDRGGRDFVTVAQTGMRLIEKLSEPNWIGALERPDGFCDAKVLGEDVVGP